jgi:hypothetical protein
MVAELKVRAATIRKAMIKINRGRNFARRDQDFLLDGEEREAR